VTPGADWGRPEAGAGKSSGARRAGAAACWRVRPAPARAPAAEIAVATIIVDVEALKRTLREDALLQMPPFPAWFLGRDTVAEFYASVFALGGSFRFVPTRSNGQLAFGLYLRRDTDMFVFRHIQVLTVFADGIARIDAFQAKGLPDAFGLPEELPG
jgi:hypothetical protein